MTKKRTWIVVHICMVSLLILFLYLILWCRCSLWKCLTSWWLNRKLSPHKSQLYFPIPVWTVSCNKSVVWLANFFSHQLHWCFLFGSCLWRQWHDFSQFVTKRWSQSVHLYGRSPSWTRLWWSWRCIFLINVALHIWKNFENIKYCSQRKTVLR